MSSMRQSIASIMLPMVRLAGRAYIAGTDLQDALSVAHRLHAGGYSSSIAYWDAINAAPEEVLEAYLSAARALNSAETSPEPGMPNPSGVDCYLSVKPPSLKFDPVAFARIVGECKKGNLRLHFDSLGPETAEPALNLAEELLRDYRNVSVTLPGAWTRSVRDAEWAIGRGIGVRVVKGQWPDPNDNTLDPVRGFLKVVHLLAGRAAHVAVASHNPLVVRQALDVLLRTGTPCQVELLYGLPVEPVLRIAKEMGVSARIYIPYGYGWLPYSLSQARHNPRILWWILKDIMQRNHKGGVYQR